MYINRILIIAVLSVFFCSCKKEKKKTTNYQVHSVGIGSNDSGIYALYWLNGKQMQLSKSINSWAFSIFVSNADVYIGGHEYHNGLLKPVFWKNGVINYLSDKKGVCNKIFKENNSIYFVGFIERSIVVWNNGIIIKNYPIENYNTYIFDSKFSNGHLYYCGLETDRGKFIPKLWKDGVKIPLEPSGYFTYKLNVVNSDIYVLGYNLDNTEKVLWKNGSKSTISSYSGFGLIDITNDQNDIYIAAYEFNSNTNTTELKVWKNGVKQSLTVKNNIYPKAFKIANGDFYWGGFQEGGRYRNAIYYKNEIPFILNNTMRTEVEDIFIERTEN
jgi:hypothetical protein